MKKIKIHTPESSFPYMRRGHETRGVIRYLKDKTEDQPNFRRNRALRTLQGLDYLHALRGLKGIEFFDYDIWTEHRIMRVVRDWTFMLDLRRVVMRPKSDYERQMSQLRNLAPLVGGHIASNELWRAIEPAIYAAIRFNCVPNCLHAVPEPGHVPLGRANFVDVHDEGEGEGDDNANSDADSTASTSDGGSDDSDSDDGAADDDDEDGNEDGGEQDGTRSHRNGRVNNNTERASDELAAATAAMHIQPSNLEINFDFDDDNMHLAGDPHRGDSVGRPLDLTMDDNDQDDGEDDDGDDNESESGGEGESEADDENENDEDEDDDSDTVIHHSPQRENPDEPEGSLFIDNCPNTYSSEDDAMNLDDEGNEGDDESEGVQRDSIVTAPPGGEEAEGESPLFFGSPAQTGRTPFTTKVETPSASPPGRAPSIATANRNNRHSGSRSTSIRPNQTPARQDREESSLYVTPTRYGALVPSSAIGSAPSTREQTRELTTEPTTQFTMRGTTPTGTALDNPIDLTDDADPERTPRKRRWGEIYIKDDDEEDDGMPGAAMKKPRQTPSPGGGSGAEMDHRQES